MANKIWIWAPEEQKIEWRSYFFGVATGTGFMSVVVIVAWFFT